MKREHARSAILFVWKEWRATHLPPGGPAGESEALRFFEYLQAERPHLLSFQPVADPWQDVHGWLRKIGYVSD